MATRRKKPYLIAPKKRKLKIKALTPSRLIALSGSIKRVK
jgi:hypothetical protein